MGGGKREREGGEEGEATTLVDFYLYFAFELYGISCGFTGLEVYSLNTGTGTGTVTLAWPGQRVVYSLLGQTRASLLKTSLTCLPWWLPPLALLLLLLGDVLSLRPHCCRV